MLSQLLLNGVFAGSVYALVALGFVLIYATGRFFNFAHGALYTTGAYLAYSFNVCLGLPLYVALFLAVSLTSLVGGLVEIGIYRQLRKAYATSMILLLISLGLFVIIQNIISLLFGDDTKSFQGIIEAEAITILGASITPIQIVIIAASLTLCSLTWVTLHLTRMGRVVRAVANDAELSTIIGVDSNRVISLVFVLGSALAAVAAILAALDNGMVPKMGFNALLMGVTAVIVGGVGSVPGAILGGLFVGLAQHIGAWKLPTQWQDAIVFVILIVFLVLRPQGFLGKPLRSAAI